MRHPLPHVQTPLTLNTGNVTMGPYIEWPTGATPMESAERTGRLIREARTGRGWGQLRFVSEMRRVATRKGEALPADSSIKRRIASWENGHSSPDEFYTGILCAALGKAAGELGLGQDRDQGATLTEPHYPTTPEGAISELGQLWRADLDSTEALLTAAPASAAWHEASVTWLVSPESSRAARDGNGVHVGLGDVATIKTTTDMFAQLDNTFGGGHARHALIQYLNNDVAQLLRGRYTESVGKALFSTVAEATLLAAWMSYDSGHHGLAQRYYLQGLRLAQEGGDRRLAGSILSAMSHQATYLGNYREAATLARAALMGISRVATPTLRAQFHSMEARALARAGDVRACELALADSTGAFEARNNGDEPEWITYFSETELADEAGHCFRDVGHARQAVEHAQQAMSGTHVRSDFFATMVLADAQLRAGEPDEACTVALDALDLGAQLKSARCVLYLSEFREHLTDYADTAAARDFHEQAADHRLWQQTTPPRAR